MFKVLLASIVILTGLYCDIDFDALEKKPRARSSVSFDFSDANKRADKAWQKKKEENRRRFERQKYTHEDLRYGLPQSQCYRTSGSYALYKYCKSGDCSGFASSYELYQLCQYDNTVAFGSSARNTEIYRYLKGNLSQLSYDYFSNQAAYQSGKHNGSFQERKNFILYLLSGMVLVRY